MALVLGDDHRSSDVEKLLFVNHTECECQPKPTLETSTATPSITATEEPHHHKEMHHHKEEHMNREMHSHKEMHNHKEVHSNNDLEHKEEPDHYPQGDQKYRKCRLCPSPFCVRELEDGRCSCDCFDRHRPCIRIKRGRDALSDAERRLNSILCKISVAINNLAERGEK
ncbi:PDGF_2 domain-containing protein [Trichonephila clavata]|uniref:PDGF_2 domain-containing protein n=1 Tax=Trichonephila clavata TaxID=2740835 RepID=A0A8X6K8L6_TRICU|nr:PDGF_2 domain-containing protein [Trichonephila clavata]